MRALPTGTVTFLFTDIEGSTRMWEKSPAEMGTALARHDTLLRASVERHDGAVFKTVGDAFCAAFHTATDALAAAHAAQMAVDVEPWPDAVRIKVRMALHTGAAEVRDEDYFGQPLNRVARLLSAGYGGQVLLSLATQELVRDSLPAGIALRDMGERRLRDLIRPEHVFQLVASDLPAEFPPLKTLDARAHNLPIQSTSFIGRDREMQEVKALLRSSRLVTLTGSGGAGKTRLSLQVGADVIDDFTDGVWFVELAPLIDARFIPQAVASILGVKEERGAAIAATLIRTLANKELLLVLDNCEHLVDAVSRHCAELLAACPGVRILATSRESLHVPGESSYRVPSLATPDPSMPSGMESLTQYAAVQLFIDRATAARTEFRVSNANAPAVASICHRLDGIPFALELAAARVRSLSVEEIDHRLDRRFALLTGGSRTALPRQQTLRALMDWSHDLLPAPEQQLLARLAVFVAGFTMEAVEAVCTDASLGADAIVDGLDALVDKSLVVAEERDGAMRYGLLETVRQYASERLRARGEERRLQAQHCAYFVALAEDADPNLTGPDQKAWLERLETEHDNVRAVLSWAGKADVASGLRLGGALWMFWVVRGHFTEGRRWLAAFIGAAPPDRDGNALAKALNGAGALARHQGDYAAARSCFEQCLVLYRESHNRRGIAAALANLGTVTQSEGDYAPARTFHEESLAIRREFGDRKGIANSLTSLGVIASDQGDYATAWSRQQEALALYREMGNSAGVAMTLNNLGNVAHARGDYPVSRALQEESLAIKRSLGDPWGVASSLNNLGNVSRDEGDLVSAKALHEESLAMRRKIGDRVGVATSLVNLAGLALAARDHPAARASYGEGLTLFRELGDKRGIAAALEDLGSVALAAASPERAIRIWGGASRLREDARCPMPPNEQAGYREEIDGARATVGDEAFERAWQEGRAMTLDQVIAYALETQDN